MSDWSKPAKFKIGDIITGVMYDIPEIFEVKGYILDSYLLLPLEPDISNMLIEFTWEQEEVEDACKLHTGYMAAKQFDKDLAELLHKDSE